MRLLYISVLVVIVLIARCQGQGGNPNPGPPDSKVPPDGAGPPDGKGPPDGGDAGGGGPGSPTPVPPDATIPTASPPDTADPTADTMTEETTAPPEVTPTPAPDPGPGGETTTSTEVTTEATTIGELLDPCDSSPCENSGTCFPDTDVASGFGCQCGEGWMGDTCDLVDLCSTSPCVLDGVSRGDCTHTSERAEGFRCACFIDYTGSTCEADVDHCEDNDCEHGATCQSISGGMYECTCAPGFGGEKCEIEINYCEDQPCDNAGVCERKLGGYICDCSGTGFSGSECQTNIDDCADDCANGATCVDGINSFNCTCVTGWKGTLCDEEINECTDIEFPHDCDINANCTNTVGGYNCTCYPAYSGDGQICHFLSSCEDDTCGHGYCKSSMNGYECFCGKGWSGNNCTEDVDECLAMETTLCDQALGVCTNTEGGYDCSCTDNAWGDGYVCVEKMIYEPFVTEGGEVSDSDDGIIGPIYVMGGFSFFGKLYWDIYVSVNGYLTFGQSYTRPEPKNTTYFPPAVPIVAPYWMDLEGPVHVTTYDKTSNRSDPVVNNVFTYIVGHSSDLHFGFEPKFILMATWDQVAPYPEQMYEGKQNVTFQVLIATDGTRSMAVYNYDRERMYLSPLSNNWTVVLGHSDGTTHSQQLDVADILRPDQSSNYFIPGRYVYGLGDDVVNKNWPCLDWYQKENEDQGPLHEALELAEPCPCTSTQADLDTRFVHISTGENICYQPRFIKDGDPWHICCYDETVSGIVTGPGSGHLVLGTDTPDDYSVCCTDVHLCNLFYSQRPPNGCYRYKPPSWGAGWGDPHLITFDLMEYTFNGYGEFMLSSNNDYMVQGRTNLATSLTADNPYVATTFTAFACGGTNMPHLEIRLDENTRDDFRVHVDGLNKGTIIGLPNITEFSNMHIIKSGEKSLIAQFRNGISLKVGVAQEILWFRMTIPEQYRENSTEGLLGNFDGDQNTELLYRNKTEVPAQPSEQDIFYFGNDWRVTEEESLFTYDFDGGSDFQKFHHPDHIPTFYGDLISNLTDIDGVNETLAAEVCGENVQCLTDYVFSKDIDFANGTKMQYMENEEFGKEIRLMAPLNVNPSTLQVTIGEQFTIDLRAVNINRAERLSYGILTDIVMMLGDSIDETTGVFTWTPARNLTEEGAPKMLRFYVRDTLGGVAVFAPIIMVNACMNGEPIPSNRENVQYTDSKDNIHLLPCNCNYGYTGDYCERVTDPCSQPCSAEVDCVMAQDGTYDCGDCPEGTVGENGLKCYDLDECLSEVSGCEQGCVNLRGSYQCLCGDGFKLGTDQQACMDDDECTMGVPHHNCIDMGEFCHNTMGAFECQCKAGFYQENDTCKPAPRRYGGQLAMKAILLEGSIATWSEDMADETSPKFKAIAAIVEYMVAGLLQLQYPEFLAAKVYRMREGSMVVMFDLFFGDGANVNGTAINGFLQQKLTENGCVAEGPDCQIGPVIGIVTDMSGAQDKDLCIEQRDNDCDYDSTACSSEDGRFDCQCRPGYKRWMDFTNICQDIDECDMEMHTCDNDTSMCSNLAGAFECECRFGYRRISNQTCVDVCVPNLCEHDAECVQQETSYLCMCKGIWGGQNCEEKNEEAVRFQNIAIGVGVGVGVLCLILLIVLLVTICRNRHSTSAEKYYGSGGRGGVSVEPWEASTVPARSRTSADYEMKENGSGDSLMDDPHGVHYRPAEQAPSRPTSQRRPTQGVENPSYTTADDDVESNKNTPDYF